MCLCAGALLVENRYRLRLAPTHWRRKPQVSKNKQHWLLYEGRHICYLIQFSIFSLCAHMFLNSHWENLKLSTGRVCWQVKLTYCSGDERSLSFPEVFRRSALFLGLGGQNKKAVINRSNNILMKYCGSNQRNCFNEVVNHDYNQCCSVAEDLKYRPAE